MARHELEPTRDKFEIVYRCGFGEGIMAKTSFWEGEAIFRFDGSLLTHQTLYTLQMRPGLYIEDPYFMGKTLHSCDPNAYVDMKSQQFWARKHINPGDFITIDYEATEDVLFRSFDCGCGADKCRGRISGKRNQ